MQNRKHSKNRKISLVKLFQSDLSKKQIQMSHTKTTIPSMFKLMNIGPCQNSTDEIKTKGKKGNKINKKQNKSLYKRDKYAKFKKAKAYYTTTKHSYQS